MQKIDETFQRKQLNLDSIQLIFSWKHYANVRYKKASHSLCMCMRLIPNTITIPIHQQKFHRHLNTMRD